MTEGVDGGFLLFLRRPLAVVLLVDADFGVNRLLTQHVPSKKQQLYTKYDFLPYLDWAKLSLNISVYIPMKPMFLANLTPRCVQKLPR